MAETLVESIQKETWQADFQPHVENPFKIEVAGLGEGQAALRIRTSKYLYGDGSVELPDIQQFVHEALPGRNALFHAAPAIQFEGPVYVEAYRKIPGSLYDEERDSRWREVIQDKRRASMERLLDGLLPTIDTDLDSVTQDQVENLAGRIHGVKVEATFYSQWSQNPRRRRVSRKESMLSAIAPQLYNSFAVVLEGGNDEEPLLRISLFPGFDQVYCVFQDLFYRGTPDDIERVIEKFGDMMKKTPAYTDSLEQN